MHSTKHSVYNNVLSHTAFWTASYCHLFLINGFVNSKHTYRKWVRNSKVQDKIQLLGWSSKFPLSSCTLRKTATMWGSVLHSTCRLSSGTASCCLTVSSWRWELVRRHQGITFQLQLLENFGFYSRVTWTFILYKTVVTTPVGAMNCQLPKSNQQINGVLPQQKAVTPIQSGMLFLNCHNPI